MTRNYLFHNQFTRTRCFLITYLLLLLLAACSPEQEPGCSSGGVAILPTATRQADPDLDSPPATPPNGGDGTANCPTPPPGQTPTATPASGFLATDVVNLSLDIPDQTLADSAAGDDMLAVAWLSEGDIYIALSRGGSHFQTRLLDSGTAISLAFSPANRLHVAYEQDGRILYRAADQGVHPAEAESIYVADGISPQVVVDERNWAHVLYEQNNNIYKARHLSGNAWQTQFVTTGSRPQAWAFRSGRSQVFGIPAGGYWFGIFLTTIQSNEVRVLRFLSWFNLWQQVAVFPLPAGEELSGSANLHYLAAGEDEAWVYAAWVGKRPNANPPAPTYSQPLYEAVNPLFPDQVANPNQIFAGLNAVRWGSQATPFAAGLMQTVSIPDPAGWLSLSAQGLAETAGAADFTLRLGLDPTGGVDPAGPNVIWSTGSQPINFSPFTLAAPATGGSATVFLEATQNTADSPATAIWDAVEMQNGDLLNGSFEGPFVSQSTMTVPESWTAYYRDSGNAPAAGRDVYTVYAAWSSDGGSTWSAPAVITENRDTSGSITGAIRPAVYPLISMATDPPSASFVFIYETGDPPPYTGFLRFGRPYLVRCELATTDCTDSPGESLLPRLVIRPAFSLSLFPDPFNSDRAVMAWDSLQEDMVNKDVHLSTLVMR